MANTFSSCIIFWLIQVVTFQTIPQRRFATNDQAAALCLGVFSSFPSRWDGLRVLVQMEQMAQPFILLGPLFLVPGETRVLHPWLGNPKSS